MLGILGGTFDPIHYGHLRPAQETARALRLRELRLIPCGQPPHRSAPAASGSQRLRMAALACAEFPGFVADEREVARPGPSYTVDTLASVRVEIGERPLCLLLGADAFAGIETWHNWRHLLDLAHIVVMRRPGSAIAEPLPAWANARLATAPEELSSGAAGRIYFVPVTPQDISSTRIRAALARGEPVEPWLPKPVYEFIRTQQLYIQSVNR